MRAADAIQVDSIDAFATGRLQNIRVLVVDDDREARELFAAILEGAGASVTAAASANDALDVLRRDAQDVLVSDIEMPDVDGYALVRAALGVARDRGDRLKTIAVTAYSRAEDEARSHAAGFDRHVRKPIEPRTLVSAVHSVWAAALPHTA